MTDTNLRLGTGCCARDCHGALEPPARLLGERPQVEPGDRFLLHQPGQSRSALAAVVSAVRAGADTWALQSTAAFAFTYAGKALRSRTRMTPSTWCCSATHRAVRRLRLPTRGSAAPGFSIRTSYSGTARFNSSQARPVARADFISKTSPRMNSVTRSGSAIRRSASATMYPSVSSCNSANRSLDADDLAGYWSIYGPRNHPPPPAPPTGLRFVR